MVLVFFVSFFLADLNFLLVEYCISYPFVFAVFFHDKSSVRFFLFLAVTFPTCAGRAFISGSFSVVVGVRDGVGVWVLGFSTEGVSGTGGSVPNRGMVCISEVRQIVQVLIRCPSDVTVGGVTVDQTPHECPKAGISSCVASISPQTEQYVPSVRPVVMQVAG